jgi:hypothetical protein
MIVIILARFFYNFIFKEFNIFKFTTLAVIIQIIHDILFYLLFSSVPSGYNQMLDFFKEYAKEVGSKAIIGDSFMMILACLFTSHYATYNLNTNIILLILTTYLLPFMINY